MRLPLAEKIRISASVELAYPRRKYGSAQKKKSSGQKKNREKKTSG